MMMTSSIVMGSVLWMEGVGPGLARVNLDAICMPPVLVALRDAPLLEFLKFVHAAQRPGVQRRTRERAERGSRVVRCNAGLGRAPFRTGVHCGRRCVAAQSRKYMF